MPFVLIIFYVLAFITAGIAIARDSIEMAGLSAAICVALCLWITGSVFIDHAKRKGK